MCRFFKSPKNYRMKYKKKFKLLLKKTPDSIRAPIIRGMYKFKFDEIGDYEFTLANTFDDKIAASRIVQQNYVAGGLTTSEAELRVSQFTLLPSTFVFIAKHKKSGNVVATMSLVIRTSLGLPIEDYVDISELIEDGRRAAELSAFAVMKEFRSQSKGLSILLMFYTMRYAIDILGLVHTFISVQEKVDYFYKDLFFFEAVAKPMKYEGVNNLPSSPLYLHTEKALVKLKNAYGNKEISKNIYKQITTFPWRKHCDFSFEKNRLVSRFYFKQSEINKLIDEQNLKFTELSHEHKRDLQAIYFKNIFESVDSSNIETMQLRKSPRFLTLLEAFAEQGDLRFVLEIQEVSISGLMVRSENPLIKGTPIHLKINIDDIPINLSTIVVWQSNKLAGLKLMGDQVCQHWLKMLHTFDEYILEQERKQEQEHH